MSKLLVWCDAVANALLQFFRIRKAPLVLAVEQELPFQVNLEHTGRAGDEDDLTQLVRKRPKQFLGDPSGTRQKATPPCSSGSRLAVWARLAPGD